MLRLTRVLRCPRLVPSLLLLLLLRLALLQRTWLRLDTTLVLKRRHTSMLQSHRHRYCTCSRCGDLLLGPHLRLWVSWYLRLRLRLRLHTGRTHYRCATKACR